jgi:hypothetical protein
MNWFTALVSPVTDLFKTIDVSGNDKRKLKNDFKELENAFSQMQTGLYSQVLELEKSKLEMHAKLVENESKSEHWIVYGWRPAISIILTASLMLSAYGIGNPGPELYDLASIILGGTIGSRGLEKVAKVVTLGKK